MPKVYENYKYNPEDFDSPVRDSMRHVYDLIDSKASNIEIHYAVVNVFFDVKEAVKFQEIDPILGQDIQKYFLRMT